MNPTTPATASVSATKCDATRWLCGDVIEKLHRSDPLPITISFESPQCPAVSRTATGEPSLAFSNVVCFISAGVGADTLEGRARGGLNGAVDAPLEADPEDGFAVPAGAAMTL